MSETKGAHQWAFRITHILNQALDADHFPINVALVAQDLSHGLYPDDPITLIKPASLPGFEGALVRAPKNKTGWGILYNQDVRSIGRINFTLAHEFGHYLIHRIDGPPDFDCTSQDTFGWDSDYKQREREANQFAANLLMPLDDFRGQLSDDVRPSVDEISHCADRYEVSFMAACLRWIDYTRVPAVFIVSRDGFVLWARSSKAAMRRKAYIKTSDRTVPVPSGAVAAMALDHSARRGVELPENVWFAQPCRELAFSADAYDYVFSIVIIDD